MKFRTELPAPRYPFHIEPDSRLMFCGSCFSEHVSSCFADRGFAVCANPFGILFNPLSIAQGLDFLTGQSTLTERYFLQHEGRWVSLAHHGKFSYPDQEVFRGNIEAAKSVAADFLKNADLLFITLGTSYYYFHLERQVVVANCHKLPAAAFEKRRATIEEVVKAFGAFFAWRAQHCPSMKVVFTVSPVRHLADGFHENQLSKSILHLAIEQLISQHSDTYYFPVYEMFQDDLRDYRFYDSDLCHPSRQGIAYVQERIAEVFFTEQTRQHIKEVERQMKQAAHRPLHTM